MADHTWTVEDHLREQPERSVELYERFADAVRGLGDVTLSVSKSTITFKGPRRGFAGGRPTRNGLRGYFDLARSLGTDDPRIRSAVPYQSQLHVHQFTLTELDQLDEEFMGWLVEAYGVGCGTHLRR